MNHALFGRARRYALCGIAAAAVAGCPTEPRPSRPRTTASASTTAPSGAGAPQIELCRVAGAKEKSRVRTMWDAARAEAKPRVADHPWNDVGAPPWLGGCLGDARGGWLISLSWVRVEAYEPLMLSFRWVLQRIDESGTRAEIAPATPCGDGVNGAANGRQSGFGSCSLQTFEAFDFDGDGTSEVFSIFHVHEDGTGPQREQDGKLWTARDRSIELYAPAKELEIRGLEDVDRDGRPDVVMFPFAQTLTGCDGNELFWPGPRLIGHALADGAFSRVDAVAAGEARKACPAKPGRLAEPDSADGPATNTACAILWGDEPARVVARLRAECGALRNATCKSGGCQGQKDLERVANTAAPRLLR